ncbi:MAG: hypothetical protein A3F54_00355 [Candidatus Kerfeldbacteria bacterium RIFCSPHIGHO2_12_FULL_48_17]|uniref:Uncharacterized protein n=1 Tax=Candidatus Kerfeldbacteria bacterium RIFCSPHIGHO2_12_FULL_48_17 TaxID=1798542 RepID=A0A1G2B5Y2_9BACT|nr:MAG: hypothetical protein A3F54_00355 [Candidatus Kerfeldbacteria bacterium RIFCSPHIGHO2_12_FULL_48_17]
MFFKVYREIIHYLWFIVYPFPLDLFLKNSRDFALTQKNHDFFYVIKITIIQNSLNDRRLRQVRDIFCVPEEVWSFFGECMYIHEAIIAKFWTFFKVKNLSQDEF